MLKSTQIFEHGPNGPVDIDSHASRNLYLAEEKYTLHRLLCPMTSLLSLFGFNVTMKRGHCAFAWRCFVVLFIVFTSINRIYLLIKSSLNPSVETSMMTAQMFLIVLVLVAIFTFLWLFGTICRLRSCLERVFLILNYVWNNSNSRDCKSPYKRFKKQMLPCIIFTLIVTFTPGILLILYLSNLSTSLTNTNIWDSDYHAIISRISEIILCFFAVPFTVITMGLFEGICCMLSLALSESVDLTGSQLRRLYKMDGEYVGKSHTVRENPSIAHLFKIERPKISPIQNSLKELDNQIGPIVRYYDRNDDLSSLLKYHHYLMNTVRQVDELFSSINFIWYSSEILEIVLCVRASNLNGTPNLVWLTTTFICTFPLIVRSMYASKVNSQV